MLPLFEDLLKNSKRRVVRKKNIEGFVVTNSIRIDSNTIGINNVFDAAMFIPPAYLFYKKYGKMRTIFDVIKNAVRVVLRERQYTTEKFPQLDE